MAAPHIVIPRLEGMIGAMQPGTFWTSTDTGVPPQAIAQWVEMCKMVMRSPTLRDQTDWEFYVADGVLPAGVALDATSGTLYAVLIREDDSSAERDWVALFDAGVTALDGSALGSTNTLLTLYQMPAADTNNVSIWHGMVYPQGLVYGTGLSASADGRDGTDPAATDVTVYALVRT